jgi:hypothetical protein
MMCSAGAGQMVSPNPPVRKRKTQSRPINVGFFTISLFRPFGEKRKSPKIAEKLMNIERN